MEQKTIYILVEPSIMTPIWHANSIEGLKRSAARQKRSVMQIRSVEELDSREKPVALVIISTNTDWTRGMMDACRQRNIRPIWIGGMPRKFGEDVSGTMYSSKSSVQEMLQYFVTVNICLAIFNLIPIPPLDGSHVLHNLLPNSPYSNPRVRQIA